MTALEPQTPLTLAELGKVRALIYKETGILFEDKKDYFLQNRVVRRMAAKGCAGFSEYYQEVLFGRKDDELQFLIEALTINETYFFRDFPQLQGFAEKVLPKYLERKRAAGDNGLRIWSAASSTGEEAYTLSIILQEMLDDYSRWAIKIDATDIDRDVLRHAREGTYSERSMKDTPLAYRQKYFRKVNEGWQIIPALEQSVDFQFLNLMDHASMRLRKGYDFIFCRNVLIYFSDESRKRVVNSLYDAMAPRGYLFLGHSESVGRITAAFTLERLGDFLCYRK